MKLEQNNEYDMFEELRKKALAVGVSIIIGISCYGIVDAFAKKIEKYGIPEYKIYDIKAASDRMNNAIDMQDAGKCGSLEDCFIKAGEEP